MGGLLHLVQRGGNWAEPQPAQAPPSYQMYQPTHQRPVYQLRIIRLPLESKGLRKIISCTCTLYSRAVVGVVQVELYWELQSCVIPRLSMQRCSAAKLDICVNVRRRDGVQHNIPCGRSPVTVQLVDWWHRYRPDVRAWRTVACIADYHRHRVHANHVHFHQPDGTPTSSSLFRLFTCNACN